MSRKSREFIVEKIFPAYPTDPDEIEKMKKKFDDGMKMLAGFLAETIKKQLAIGNFIIVDNKIVINHEKIERDKKIKAKEEREKENNVKIFIYTLIDPRDDSVKYVGQTRSLETRFISHLRHGAPLVSKWVKELAEEGMRPSIKVIDETIKKRADRLERKYIKQYCKKFSLLNTAHNY